MSIDSPPDVEFPVDVGAAEIEFYRVNGYLVIDRIAPDAEIAWLTAVYDTLISAPRSGLLDTVFDLLARYGSTAEPRLGQLLFPEKRVPELCRTNLWRNARRIAARLLELPPAEMEHWGHLLYKTGDGANETPWHQDEAYWDVNHDYHAVGAWTPLTDVDETSGCLWFVPGSHRSDVLGHRHVGDDPAVHALELIDTFDMRSARPIPMRAGGMSFHHPRTLHFAGANRSGAIRRAWANEFQSAPIVRETPADRPWVAEGHRALRAAQTRSQKH